MSGSETHSVTTDRRREYRFGDFTVDVDGGVLRHGTDELTLRPKTFAVLAYLVERHGRLVTKTELLDAVWPDAVVTDNSLAQCLLEIRRALKDDAQEIIRTRSRRGYIFAAPLFTPTLSFPPGPDRFPRDDPPAAPAAPPSMLPSRVAVASWALWVALAAIVTTVIALQWMRPAQAVVYRQLTNFTDSVTSPAISPDGRMLAFIRGSRTFLDPGQLYVKLLPDGEPVALTDDDHLKMAPAFFPDGSRIAYTVVVGEESGKWQTWSVSVLGGDPQPLFANAAALTWIGNDRVLFSEIKHGVQMGVVTASKDRSDVRNVYVPPGMAHRSTISPDHRWVLISSEMNSNGWLPCRVAPIDGRAAARVAGPAAAKCTHAAWSPDGRWMYFSAEVDGGFHTWRQRFPDGTPEQVTFGATEEEGIAVWPDGRSFASSVGATSSSIWVHDDGHERQMTSEGFGHSPSFSTDGKTLYYLLRVPDAREWAAGHLWAIDLSTNKRRRILPGASMAHYAVSDDGARIVFVRTDAGNQGVWLAHVDGRGVPVQLSADSNTRAFFGPAGTVVFTARDGQARRLFRIREDGSGREAITADPFIGLMGVSADGRWAILWAVADERRQLVGYPLEGGQPVAICDNCADSEGGPAARGRTPRALSWSTDGRFLYLRLQPPREPLYETGRTYVLPLPASGGLPPTFKSEAEVASRPEVTIIAHGGIFPGPRPSLYAYTRATTHRNIYRISLP